MKGYYSCLDIGCSDLVTQPIQHLVNGTMAERLGGRVVFYTAEDPETLATQLIIRDKIAENEAIDGIIFFRLKQFAYGPSFNFRFLRELLEMGREVHFAREALSLTNLADLDRTAETLLAYDHIQKAS